VFEARSAREQQRDKPYEHQRQYDQGQPFDHRRFHRHALRAVNAELRIRVMICAMLSSKKAMVRIQVRIM
jgi:hypothetical protein